MSYPGVYMREVPSGVRPIQGAGTSTAAFLGKAARGPIGTAVRMRNFTEFRTTFGGFLNGNYLAHAVFQFFNNGGSTCYVVRVVGADAQAAAATAVHDGLSGHESLRLTAASKGAWGNALEVEVAPSTADPDNCFDLVVFLGSSGTRNEVERWTDLSMDPGSPRFVETVLRLGSTYLRATAVADAQHAVGGFAEGTKITTADAGTVLDADHRTFRISLNGDGLQTVDLTGADLSSLDKIRGALESAIAATTPLRLAGDEDPYPDATVSVQGTGPMQSLRVTSGKPGPRSTVEIAPGGSPAVDAARLLGLYPPARTVGGAAVLRPADDGNPYLIGDGVETAHLKKPIRGDDGGAVQPDDYIAAFRVLDTVRDVSLIAVPGIGTKEVVEAGLTYCAVLRPLSDCFFIADTPREVWEPDDVGTWRDQLGVANSYGAVYYPWLKVPDPNRGPDAVLAPPSGFVAGVYARTDAQRGVWKTPAGVQASVAGAVGLARELTDLEQGDLNLGQKSVCVVRHFPASGTVVWGGRTLDASAEWPHIAPRRMAIFLRKSIFDGIQWAVFEPNDEPLWSQLRLNLNAFMTTLFRRGAFQGSTPDDAFFVKVDSETTQQADIDAGVVNIQVGFAPLKPAEFVVVQLSQKAGQSG